MVRTMNETYYPSDDLDALLGTGPAGPDAASSAWWDRFFAADPGAAQAARGLTARLRGSRPGPGHRDRQVLVLIQCLLGSIHAYVQRTGDVLPAPPDTGPRRASTPIH